MRYLERDDFSTRLVSSLYNSYKASDIYCDGTISTSNSVQLKGHKIVLATFSQSLAEKFNGSRRQKNTAYVGKSLCLYK